MNERQWNKNGFAALISIDDGVAHAYTNDEFIRKLINDWNNKDKEGYSSKFNISITSAGMFFSYFITYYEYYARGLLSTKKMADKSISTGILPMFPMLNIDNSRDMSSTEYNYHITAVRDHIETVKETLIKEVVSEIEDASIFIGSSMGGGETVKHGIYGDQIHLLFCYDGINGHKCPYSLPLMNRTIGYISNVLQFIDIMLPREYNSKIADIEEIIFVQFVDLLCEFIIIKSNNNSYFNYSNNDQRGTRNLSNSDNLIIELKKYEAKINRNYGLFNERTCEKLNGILPNIFKFGKKEGE
jgi:hypothetical protein